MAAYTVAAGQIAVHAKTAVANTEDTVTFTDDCQQVEVVSDGAAALYVSVDGTAATVGGANCYVLPAGSASSRVITSLSMKNTIVSLKSAGTPTYSVSRAA